MNSQNKYPRQDLKNYRLENQLNHFHRPKTALTHQSARQGHLAQHRYAYDVQYYCQDLDK